MRSCIAAALACLPGLLPAAPARALQFMQVAVSSTEVVVGGQGPIVKGDTARLEQALASVPAGKQLRALALDSPGGNVVEGEQLARTIRAGRLPVVIPSNSKCVSACFLLFAASPRRMAASDALIGVHSASEAGHETDTSLAVTTLMARVAGELGIPPAIIGKMVQTTPGRVEWLTREDLVSMDVTVYDGDTATGTQQTTAIGPSRPVPVTAPPPSGTASPPPAPAAPVSPPQPAAAASPPAAMSGFAAGREDRRVWNGWLLGLRGAYRDGAVYAQSQVGLPQPGSCLGPQGVNRGDFTAGCELGRQRLAAVDSRMRSSPDYAAGWNGREAATQAPSGPQVEGEYQGALFCKQQAARLTLTLLPAAGEPHRSAIFGFGPLPTSPTVPRGSFIVEGSIGVHGGEISLVPVRWVSQPAGFSWLGLSGRSDDGGRTFSGRVTDSTNQCTTFTLARVGSGGTSR